MTRFFLLWAGKGCCFFFLGYWLITVLFLDYTLHLWGQLMTFIKWQKDELVFKKSTRDTAAITILVFTDSTSCFLLFNGLPLKCQIKLKNDCYNFPHISRFGVLAFVSQSKIEKTYINISLIHWLHKNIKSLQLLIWMPTNASNVWFSLVVPTLLRVRKITEFSLMADNGEDKTRKKNHFCSIFLSGVFSLCSSWPENWLQFGRRC